MVRQSDNVQRQLDNIPGGFQILERLHNDIADPLCLSAIVICY
jgi:hypothetical protein